MRLPSWEQPWLCIIGLHEIDASTSGLYCKHIGLGPFCKECADYLDRCRSIADRGILIRHGYHVVRGHKMRPESNSEVLKARPVVFSL